MLYSRIKINTEIKKENEISDGNFYLEVPTISRQYKKTDIVRVTNRSNY